MAVNSCVELWIPQIEKMEMKAKKENKKGNELLKEVFNKYNVSFEDSFKINSWNKSDQEKFIKGMILYGYKSNIHWYMWQNPYRKQIK